MSQYNIKSTIISGRDATPKVLVDPYISGGKIKESQGSVQTGSATDAVGSTYRLCQVPSNARITSLTLQNDALGGAVNVGVYWPTYVPNGNGLSSGNATTAINASCLASAFSVSTANSPTELITRANVSIPNQEVQLWQVAGLSADPEIYLDIVATVSTIMSAQGSIGLKAKYL